MGTDSGRKYRILIVEDDLTLADGLCRALRNNETETVSCHTLKEAEKLLEAANGRFGTDTAFGTAFDLVVLDVNLPDGNGFDYLQKIKEKYDIFVIMLTANDMETDIVAGLEAGADDYITKPFSLAVLRARVATQLRRAGIGERSNGINGGTAENGAQPAVFAADEGWILDGAIVFTLPKCFFIMGRNKLS